MPQPRHPDATGSQPFRTLFLSDFHLGIRHCQADLLAGFLERHDAETIYLVGDIVDVWRLRKRRYWPESHARVLRMLLERAEAGCGVVYLPGNHDEVLRRSTNLHWGPVRFADSVEHQAADGKRYLVVHGDQYDVVMQKARWLAFLGDRFYAFALTTNTWLNAVRRRLGLGYWSLGAYAKLRVKRFVSIVGQFEDVVVRELREKGLDGVICGHIHHAAIRDMNGFCYVNTGDWVESCTAVAEHHDGRLEILRWPPSATGAARPAPRTARPDRA